MREFVQARLERLPVSFPVSQDPAADFLDDDYAGVLFIGDDGVGGIGLRLAKKKRRR